MIVSASDVSCVKEGPERYHDSKSKHHRLTWMSLCRLQRERRKWWSKVSPDGCNGVPWSAIVRGWNGKVLTLTPDPELQKARDRDELARNQRYNSAHKNLFPSRVDHCNFSYEQRVTMFCLAVLKPMLILRVNMRASADDWTMGRAEEEHVRLREKAELWHTGLSVLHKCFCALSCHFIDPAS